MTKSVTIDPTVAKLRGKLGGYRSRAQDDPEVVATRAALAEATLVSAIERLIASAPPLSPSQALKLRTLLDIEGVKK
jgi:hypothetical protein